MSNAYFQFKQFKIEQDKCAMKVCTDSCLFGAWIELEKQAKNILDIGTGTGLLSLMIAQRFNVTIDALEIDESAFQQAKENINNSVFANQIQPILEDINNFSSEKKYDFIICNPPFYEKQLPSLISSERRTKHSSDLTLEKLFESVKRLIKEDGKFALLLPFYRKDECEKIAAAFQLYPNKKLYIQQTPKHAYFRYAAIFSTSKSDEIFHAAFSIKNVANDYSEESKLLLSPYYLYL